VTNQFPPEVDILAINQTHPDVTANADLLAQLRLLFVGGKQLKDNGSRFLVKRQKELGTSYVQRLSKLTYTNIISSIVSYYTSKLFENNLEYDWKVDGVAALPADTAKYYKELLEDCDNSGTSLARFFENVAVESLVYGRSYFLIDLPKLAVTPVSLAEQEALGGNSPYFVHVDPWSVINYQKDKYGKFEWVVLHSLDVVQSFLGTPKNVERWSYYDKTTYAVYQAEWEPNANKPTKATLVDLGLHAMAGLQEVPLTCVETGDKLWLGNRVFLPCLDHLNTENSYGWSLWLANNPLPVFTNGKDTEVSANVTVAEYAAITLPAPDSKFEYVEPKGESWKSTQAYLESLRENIYRLCHLVAQGRSSRASATVQSAVSKEIDMQPAADVLNVFGTLIRTAIQDALEDIAEIRNDNTAVDVRGMIFSEDVAQALAELNALVDSLNIPSETFIKETRKKLVRAYLKDANSDLIQQCIDEIETAPQTQTTVTPPTLAMNVTERGSTQ